MNGQIGCKSVDRSQMRSALHCVSTKDNQRDQERNQNRACMGNPAVSFMMCAVVIDKERSLRRWNGWLFFTFLFVLVWRR